jgi:hypothetical protein
LIILSLTAMIMQSQYISNRSKSISNPVKNPTFFKWQEYNRYNQWSSCSNLSDESRFVSSRQNQDSKQMFHSNVQ